MKVCDEYWDIVFFFDIIFIVNEYVGFFKNVCCEEFKIIIYVYILYLCYINENFVLIYSCVRGLNVIRVLDYFLCLL